jgi:transcriptional regulator with XRE-family HTH domain
LTTPLGLRLRELRVERGLSLRDAASETNVDRDTIREIEHGERRPFGRTLRKLADGYGVPLRELLELEEPVLPKAEAPEASGAPGHEEEVHRLQMYRELAEHAPDLARRIRSALNRPDVSLEELEVFERDCALGAIGALSITKGAQMPETEAEFEALRRAEVAVGELNDAVDALELYVEKQRSHVSSLNSIRVTLRAAV